MSKFYNLDEANLEIMRLGVQVEQMKTELVRRANQVGVACLKHDLTHSLACGHCLEEARSSLGTALVLCSDRERFRKALKRIRDYPAPMEGIVAKQLQHIAMDAI